MKSVLPFNYKSGIDLFLKNGNEFIFGAAEKKTEKIKWKKNIDSNVNVYAYIFIYLFIL